MIDTSATPMPQHSNNSIGASGAAPYNGHEPTSAALPSLQLEPALYFRCESWARLYLTVA